MAIDLVKMSGQSSHADVGVVGMAAMGRNLAMNAASKGYVVSVYNRTTSKMETVVAQAEKENIKLHGYAEISDFVQSLQKPRKVIMMVQAGKAVEATIELLTKFLESGDILIDGGNEYYKNTELRVERTAKLGIRYMGMGVSGGEEGARYGPSIMPGGAKDTYNDVAPILEKIAAHVDNKPCVAYMGSGSAGNYVKMVHNGIEYGDMQLIAEAYDLLKKILKYNNDQISDTFSEWNKGVLSSYLIEISARVVKTKNPGYAKDGNSAVPPFLLDVVKDVAGSKGTGKWTMQEALERGVPCPTIQAALDSRYLSGFKDLREEAQNCFKEMTNSKKSDTSETDMENFKKDLEGALYCSKICSYAQGLMLLRKASEDNGYGINLGSVAGIWVGGCIIRAEFLKDITAAFDRNPSLSNLILDPVFAERLKKHLPGWRRVVSSAVSYGVPVAAFSASLAYYEALRAPVLPLNLVQAQRDHFGAHTFERTDKAGTFHADWENAIYLEGEP